MCQICGKYICPSACPSYDGESAEYGKRIDFCSECGAYLCEFEYIDYSYGKPYCSECASKRIDDNT